MDIPLRSIGHAVTRLAPALLILVMMLSGGTSISLAGERFFARAESVADGDSFTALSEAGQRIRIRLSGIDAPEFSQDHGETAREQLRQLLGRQLLDIEPLKTDPFGRLVARVSIDGEDVSLWMVRNGHAWHFIRYEQDQTPAERQRYRAAQSRAQAQRLGLWQSANPTAPWDYRAAARRR